ncbi:MAG TPA: hypothetical protein VFL29_14745 [Candidatus Dormibacteraeota bacterium]|nr:hypothetical protein [Candidatus Dormibacteraeota bacterium]
MTQLLSAAAAETLALLVYPGLITVALFGLVVEIVWSAVARQAIGRPNIWRRRPPTVQVIVALLAVLAAAQFAAPFNPVPPADRNLVIAAIAIGFTAWAELALDPELVARPGLVLVIQACWLLSVLGPAIEPESLRPQVLGNVLVPALLPVKVAAGFLYLLCLPPLMRLWPMAPPAERRARPRFNATRTVLWFPYCGLFTTLFFPPGADDVAGLVRFFGITAVAALLCVLTGSLLARRGAERARGLYARAVAPYSLLLLGLILVTLALTR